MRPRAEGRRTAQILRRIRSRRRRGGDRRSSSQNENLKSYADQAAETFGVHRSTVARDIRRGKNIAPDVLADVTWQVLACVTPWPSFFSPSPHRRLQTRARPSRSAARDAMIRITRGRQVTCRAVRGDGGRVVSYDRLIASCRIGGAGLGDLMRRAGVQEGGRGR